MIKSLYSRYEDFVGATEKSLGDNYSSIIYVLIAIVTNSGMIAWSKVHADVLPPVQSQLFRGILCTTFIYAYAQYKDIPLAVSDRRKDVIRILRNVLAAGFNVFVYFVVTKIPMSTFMLIQTSSPFMVAFLDHLYLKTSYNKIEAILSLVSLSGVALIIKPDLIVDVDLSQQAAKYGYAEGSERLFWIVVTFFGVFIWCISIVLMKALKGMHAMTLNFPFGITMMMGSALCQIEMQQAKHQTSWVYLQILVVLGLITFINQHTYVKANQLGKPAKITMLTNLNVVCSFLFEIFYLGESAHWISLVGALLIVGASVALSVSRL